MLLVNVGCSIKNAKIIPLINTSRTEVDNACRTLVTILRHFFDDKISQVYHATYFDRAAEVYFLKLFQPDSGC